MIAIPKVRNNEQREFEQFIFSFSIFLSPQIDTSLDQCDKGFSFFNDVSGELRPIAAANVLNAVGGSRRDKQNISRLERDRRLTLDLVLEQTFNHEDDLFAGMMMFGEHCFWVEINSDLEYLASGHT